ncbi:MAG: oxidoreductase [Verrucomicrobia bacterium]|nr:oxidoreductase [Verrucomicrobiota bacterium]
MSPFLACLLLALPALPFAAGLTARLCRPATAGRLTAGAAAAAAVLALLAAGALAVLGPQTVRWAPFGPDAAFAGALRLDVLSAIMVVLVTFLGARILDYARPCLAGDPHQSRFFSWMSLTLASVVLLVLAGQLLLLLAAWMATSLCLHRLLLHFPGRSGAVFAARKKFVISRLGDACLLGAALVLHAHHGTYDLAAILADFTAGRTGGAAAAGLLLAGCAMLKSAQFPFHSWLPDTMETPTPVSAFMHAGIINAGGFLVIRLAPVFAAAPRASALLAVAGALTAAFGAVVMLAQPSVKRALAYSTIAQMGFMILQCGLGAYSLALLHIAAHSLYKAHAFLTAGSTIGAVPRAAVPLRAPALTFGVLAGGLLVALGATLAHALAPTLPPGTRVFGVVLAVAVAYGLARIRAAGAGPASVARGVAVAAAVVGLSLALHGAASRILPEVAASQPPPALLAAVAAVFAGLFLFQALLWRANAHPAGHRLYVHALNGFYLGTHFNRILGRLWPRHPVNP